MVEVLKWRQIKLGGYSTTYGLFCEGERIAYFGLNSIGGGSNVLETNLWKAIYDMPIKKLVLVPETEEEIIALKTNERSPGRLMELLRNSDRTEIPKEYKEEIELILRKIEKREYINVNEEVEERETEASYEERSRILEEEKSKRQGEFGAGLSDGLMNLAFTDEVED